MYLNLILKSPEIVQCDTNLNHFGPKSYIPDGRLDN